MPEQENAAPGPTVWIDADACPKAVREIIFRAVYRRGLKAVLVANRNVQIPPHPSVEMLVVPAGADKADDRIVDLARPGDLAVTADVPLAARLVEKGVPALDPRGREFDAASIGEMLAMRNLMDSLRSAGVATGGPDELSPRDVQRFANALDRFLTARRAP